MPEWSNGAVSKTVEPIWVPGVRIPLSPPVPKTQRHGQCPCLFMTAGPKNKPACFSRPAAIKSCALLLCVFGTEASPKGTPSAAGAKVIPRAALLLCVFGTEASPKGTPSAAGAKVIPRAALLPATPNGQKQGGGTYCTKFGIVIS